MIIHDVTHDLVFGPSTNHHTPFPRKSHGIIESAMERRSVHNTSLINYTTTVKYTRVRSSKLYMTNSE